MALFGFGESYKPVVGLDIGTTAVKLVELRQLGEQWRLHRCGIKPLPTGAVADNQIKDGGAVSDAIRALCHDLRISTKQAAISVSGSAVIIKRIQLPPMIELDLENQIGLEAEEYIPFDIEDVFLDFQVLGQDAEHMDVLLVACKRELVNNLATVVEVAGLKPVIVDLDLFGISTAYETLLAPPTTPKKKRKKGEPEPAEEDDSVALVNMGDSLLNINILTDGVPVFTRDQLFGGSHLVEDIQRSYGVSLEEAAAIQIGKNRPMGYEDEVLNPFLDQLALQVGQSLDFFHASNVGHHVKALLISGGCALIPGISDYLTARTGMTVQVMNPFQKIKTGSEFTKYAESAPRLVVALGLALRGGV